MFHFKQQNGQAMNDFLHVLFEPTSTEPLVWPSPCGNLNADLPCNQISKFRQKFPLT